MSSSISLKLLPLLVLMVTSCSNDDDTNKKLRQEIELKDRQKQVLQADVVKQTDVLKTTTEELEKIRLSGGPEVVQKAEADRAAAVEAKSAAEKALVEKDAELKATLSKLDESRNENASVVASAASLRNEIEAKRTLIDDLEIKLKAASPELVAQLNLDVTTKSNEIADLKAKLDLANLNSDQVAKLSDEIKAKTSEIEDLKTKLAAATPSDEQTAKLRAELEKANESLKNLENSAKDKEKDLNASIANLTKDIEGKVGQIKTLETHVNELNLAASTNTEAVTEAQKKLDAAKKELADLQDVKKKTDSELEQTKKIIEGVMLPAMGMYYSELESLTFDGKKCRQFIYVELNGTITQAVLCDDNRAQYNKFTADEFVGVKENRLVARVGTKVKTLPAGGSCGSNKSVFESSSSFIFEKSLNFQDTTGSYNVAYDLNNEFTQLVSSTMRLNVVDCEAIVKWAGNGTVLDRAQLPVLKQSAQMCNLVSNKLIEANLDVGCFTPSNKFVK